MDKKRFAVFKIFSGLTVVSSAGVSAIVFIVLASESFFDDSVSVRLLTTVALCVITCATALFTVFIGKGYKTVSKIPVTIEILFLSASATFYFLQKNGFLNKIDSVESLREYVESFGSYAVLQFIAIQFLQVVVLPIPSLITVATGVLIFGVFKGALYSCIGIILGSLTAFLIGRVCGYKAVCWLVGKKTLDKGLRFAKGKDKYIFPLMFIFPFFPDDLLCFVAGIIKMKPRFFIITIAVTRTVAVFSAAYSVNNQIIPYDTWWGIMLWIIFFAAIVFFSFILLGSRKNKEREKNFR